ncbi:hypothetical protein FE257_003620 [Aspergillus nanangensis]|uniref:BZIP transcription factor n=1 Tax=Aspergillus nanangensis TaxID=2582783 RepID=A0AAD4CRX7_ASPNN|nr:hypothetical protein FE257_003620 [Aspergillus nanangensis]
MDMSQKSPKAPKLTGDRAARKREQDRQAQRSAREKTKKLIAHLEARIDTLTRFHSSGSVKTLIDELEKERQANEALRATLHTIQKVVNSGTSEAATEIPSGRDRRELEDPSPPIYRANKQQRPALSHCILPEGIDSNLSPITPPAASHFFQQPLISQEGLLTHALVKEDDRWPLERKYRGSGPLRLQPDASSPFDFPSLQPAESPCDCCKSLLYLNNLFGGCVQMSLPLVGDQRTRDIDIPIRAILHGWDTVCHLYPLDAVWSILRAADEAIWRSRCGEIERLAILRVVSSMLRSRAHPSEATLKALPIFMRPRPSQIRVLHKPLIDFIVWPGLRERLVLFPHQHCSDKFWSLFWTCFRFQWPHRLQDAVIQHGGTGLYRYSERFEAHFFNLQDWCMAPRFFKEFPELEADVPPAFSTSESVSLELGGQGFPPNSEIESAPEFFATFSSTDWPGVRNPLFG